MGRKPLSTGDSCYNSVMSAALVHVAIAQAAPPMLDLAGCLDEVERLTKAAAADGAQLVVFPETWIPGYPVWIYGHAPWDGALQKSAYARLLANAIEVPGPATERLSRIARQSRVQLHVGIHERDALSGGSLLNSLLSIDRDGVVLGCHRKLLPTHAERMVWGRGDGSTLNVYDTGLGRVGGLICWEHWMPLARMAMHSLREQIHIAVWPDVGANALLASRHYAFEGRCYVIAAGSSLSIEEVPDDLKDESLLGTWNGQVANDGLLLTGGSGVIGPDGEWVAGPAGSGEEILHAVLDLGRLAGEFQHFDAVGHYNRPDVFSFSVDRTPQRAVEWRGPA